MAMEVSNTYGGYSNSYAAISNKRKTETDKDDVKGKNEISSESREIRRTAADELSYLSKKYEGYTFVAANFKPRMKYGSNDTTNVAISPAFLKKMANNPELEKEYEKEIANMKACDDQKVRNIEGQGDRIIAKGWAIDKDGNISSWTIGERGGNRPKVTSPNEYAEKIRKEKAEKKKAENKLAQKKQAENKKKEALEEKRIADKEKQAALKEKIDSDSRALLGNRYKGSEWFDVSDDIISRENDPKDGLVGLNLDMKL